MNIYSGIQVFRKMAAKKQTSIDDQDICQARTVHAERVARAKESGIPERDLDHLAATYKVLGDPTRLKIVMALKDVEMCVCDLAAFLGVSESAVSHQLRRLRDLALVRKRREGQIIYYALDDEHVAALLTVGLAHIRE